MRILQVLPRLITGGVERGTLDVAQALIDAGHEAFVASAGGPLTATLEAQGARHITLPLDSKYPWTLLSNACALRRIIEDHKIDLVHARSRAPAWSTLWAARKAQVPFVTTFHGTYGLKGPGKRLYNSIMVKGDRVIAVSNFIADHILTNYTVDSNYIRIIPRGVDRAVFNSANLTPALRHTERSRLQIPDDVPVFLMPGRLSRTKGCDLVIDALGQLENKSCHVVFLGAIDNTYLHELTNHAQNLGLEKRVHFIPPTPHILAAYALADGVISASLKPEAFGRTVAEAQALGIPVIAPAHGGALELIDPNHTGWLFPPGDKKALANTLEYVLEIPQEQKKRMTQAAQDRVSAYYTNARMCQKTIQVYKELL